MNKIDMEITKDILKTFFTIFILIALLCFAVFGGVSLGNDISNCIKYRDAVNDRINDGYAVYINGRLVYSDTISIYTYPNQSIDYDDDLQRVYIGTLG